MERLVKFAILIHCPQCVVQGCRSPNKQGGYMIVFGKDLKKFLFLILLWINIILMKLCAYLSIYNQSIVSNDCLQIRNEKSTAFLLKLIIHKHTHQLLRSNVYTGARCVLTDGGNVPAVHCLLVPRTPPIGTTLGGLILRVSILDLFC